MEQSVDNMKHYLLLIPLLLGVMACNDSYSVVVTNPEIETSDIYREGNSYQRDFLLFADMLENTHPLFAEADKPHFDMDSLTRAGYQDLADCKSKMQLKYYLQAVLSRINDGHSHVSTDLSLYRKGLYPFYLFFENDTTFYLFGIKKKYADHLGKRVMSINDTPVREIIDSFRPLMSCDNDNFFKANVMRECMVWRALWDYTPYHRSDGKLLLQFEDGDTVLLPSTWNTKSYAWYQTEMKDFIREKDGMPFSYTILPEKRLCCLHFAECSDRNTLLASAKMGMAEDTSQINKMPDFGMFLKEMFGKINENEVSTLVIDVRDNGGGNSRLCDQLLSWLKPIDEFRWGGGKIRFSKLWEAQYPEYAKQVKAYFEGNGLTYPLGELYQGPLDNSEDDDQEDEIDELFMMNESRDSLFTGKVVFLQGKGTFSSAGKLITSAVDNGIGIVIGDYSTYSPNNYGDCLYWELPNTHVKGSVSHKIFYRADAARRNENVLVPDVPLPVTWEDVRNGVNPCWKWVMEQ